jgi:carbonic anhydrase/acetyltransferase-like protein (isoleucine patch superfamily)
MASLGVRAVTAASNMARKLGQSLDNLGKTMEVCKYRDKLVPSTRFVAVDGLSPTVSPYTAFVAPNASVIGDVTLGVNSSVWYGATVRGDVHKITIGENTAIMDRAVIHVAKIQGDYPSNIGNNVTVGPGAIVHAATLMDGSVVGPSAQVLDGAVVEKNAIVGPGAVVTPGSVVKEGEYWLGSPAKMVRKVTSEERSAALETCLENLELARLHAFETSKDLAQLTKDEEAYEDVMYRDPDYFQPNEEASKKGDVLGQGTPGLIFDSVLTNPEEGLKLRKKQQMAEAAAGEQK